MDVNCHRFPPSFGYIAVADRIAWDWRLSYVSNRVKYSASCCIGLYLYILDSKNVLKAALDWTCSHRKGVTIIDWPSNPLVGITWKEIIIRAGRLPKTCPIRNMRHIFLPNTCGVSTDIPRIPEGFEAMIGPSRLP